MGDPNTGEIYNGTIRKSSDVGLDKATADALKAASVEDRMNQLGQMAKDREMAKR